MFARRNATQEPKTYNVEPGTGLEPRPTISRPSYLLDLPPGSFFTLFTFHFSSILPDARLVELSQSTDSMAPGRPTRIIRGLFQALCALHECGFV